MKTQNRGVSRSTSPLLARPHNSFRRYQIYSHCASPAATSTTKEEAWRPKGSKNKPRKKQSSEQLYEEIEQQQEVLEALQEAATRGVRGGATMYGWMIHSQVNNLYVASQKLHHHELLEIS